MSTEGDAGSADGRHILIAGPPYRGYLGMIGDAFRACGLRVSALEWKHLRRNLAQEIGFYGSGRYRLRLAHKQDELNTVAIESAMERLSPDIILVMKAAQLSPKTVKTCEAKGVKRILWAYDSAREYPLITKTACDYDRVYTYEPDNVKMLSELCDARYLPMGYDPRLYLPVGGRGSGRDVDISFVGALRDTPVRKETIRHVALEMPDRTVGVWTDTIHWYSHRRLNDRRFIMGRPNIRLSRRTIDHAEINEIYNRSKVCLNVHHPQSVGALNPRTFEILGSGGLLVTDRRMDGLDGFEDGTGYIFYSSLEDLTEKLRPILENDEARRTTAEKGHQAAFNGHTFEQRAKRMLGELE
jgi:spore maturation protein CgeB